MKCWVRELRNSLLASRFGYAHSQGVGDERGFLHCFSSTTDIHISLWLNKVTDIDQLRNYKILKTDFDVEHFMNEMLITCYTQVLVKFR